MLSLLTPLALEVQCINIIQTDASVEKASLVDSSPCSMSVFYRHMERRFWWTEIGCKDTERMKAAETSDKIRSIFLSLLKRLGRVTNSRKMTDGLM